LRHSIRIWYLSYWKSDLTALLNLGSTFSSRIRIHQGPYIYW